MNWFNELNVDFFKVYLLPFVILLIVTAVDFLSGVSKALLNKQFCSSKLRSGIDKYRAYFTLAVISIIVDIIITYYFKSTCNAIAVFCIIFMIICEITSIIENCTNVTIPPILNDTINLLKELWSKENRK